VLDRLRYLADSFAIDLCAFAVMSNHYHLVVHVDRARAASWTREEVVARWARLFSIPTIIEQWQQGVGGDAVRESAEERIEECRYRLFDISCFMACLNEHVARRANAEDECTGRFWEGRFKSQALLDDPALITAMAYVDLNPVRAGIDTTPEDSKFTSIHQRIARMAAELARPEQRAADADLPLCDFQGHAVSCARTIPFRLTDYLQLLDWTRRAIGSETRAIDTRAPPILAHLRIDLAAWIAAMRPKGSVFGRALGRLDRLRLHARALGQLWIRGMRECERLYGAT
jgi:REP element-mobilizing transposase RayT